MRAKLMLGAALLAIAGASWFAGPAGAQAAGGEMAAMDIAAGEPIATCYPAWVAATAAAVTAVNQVAHNAVETWSIQGTEKASLEIPEAVLD
jgi:hypothetical protein